MNSQYLYHYGVPGMRWGHRKKVVNNKQKSITRLDKADKNKISKMKRDVKYRRLLSTEDIKKKIERLKLERELKMLTEQEIGSGKAEVKAILKSSGTKVAATVLTGSLLYSIKAAMERKFDIKEAAGFIAPKPKK